MKAWSKNNYESCKEKKIKIEKFRTFIKCGTSNSIIIPSSTPITVSNTLATLNLDLSCLCDPRIKLDFTSNYSSSSDVSVRIQIFRQCSNESRALEIGTSRNLIIGTSPIISTFTFFLCDNDICSQIDCCTYTVIVTPIVALDATSTIAFNNSTLLATVTSGENSWYRRCNY